VYRHAVAGALWAGAIFDANPFAPGRLRRTSMGSIKYFAERGALDENGLLSLGWLGRFEAMRQSYSGPGSPYWAGLGLAGLVLPESHPVWTDVEQPAPIDLEDRADAIRPIGWLVSGTAADGIVRVINHGVDHSGAVPVAEGPLYNRFAYSTVTAPVPLPDGSTGLAVDNQVALVGADGRWSQRPLIDLITIDGRRAESRHAARFARAEPDEGFDLGTELTCISLVRGSVEVRAVRIESAVQARALVISGFAVPRKPAPGVRTDLISSVTPLTGSASIGRAVHQVETTFGTELDVPWCRYEAPQPDNWYVAAVSLSDQAPKWPTVELNPTGQPIVTWPDGSTDHI
jgi:hypothetical protein